MLRLQRVQYSHDAYRNGEGIFRKDLNLWTKNEIRTCSSIMISIYFNTL